MNDPLISAVIPCRNERASIEACVRSLLAQEEPAGGIEFIVADGDSDDGTREVLDRLAAADGRLRVVSNPARTTPSGMNAGIREARGRYIAIMGAHSRYATDYLLRCWEVAERTGAANVGGVVISEPKSYIEAVIAAAHHSALSAGGSHWHSLSHDGPTDSVWGGFYRREIFREIGLFDETLVRNQDDELNLRLRKAGGEIWQSTAIRSWYRPRRSLRALYRQYQQYGYWRVRVIAKHRDVALLRHMVPPLFVVGVGAAVLVSAARAVQPRPRAKAGRWSDAVPAMIFLGPYLVILVGASVRISHRRGWRLLPVLPAALACFHIGYGHGFLLGIADVALRRPPRGQMMTLTR